MKVLVCDDLPEENREFENAIEAAGQRDIETKRLCGVRLKEQLSTLIKEVSTLIEGADRILMKDGYPEDLPETEFDKDVDLVVLDNNLAHLKIEGARLTAETVAGYVRVFSSAPYIVSVNKNPDVDFDLQYLIGDDGTRADLAVNVGHLSNPALWTGKRADAKDGFLPWYWPKLLEVGANRRAQIEFVQERLDEKVFEAFGISKVAFNYLSRQARSLLSRAEETDEESDRRREFSGFDATFRGVFLASDHSLPSEIERKELIEKLDQGVASVDSIIARAVAADIDQWFRRHVVWPQEALVDIPHLLMRMPFLLGDGANDLTHWNEAVDAVERDEPFGLDSDLFSAHLKAARFDRDVWARNVWAPSPCFWWPTLREDDELNSYFSKSGRDWADVVFCEDRSMFLPFGPDEGATSPCEFVAQFEGSWNRRYVKSIEGMRYVPKTQFAQ